MSISTTAGAVFALCCRPVGCLARRTGMSVVFRALRLFDAHRNLSFSTDTIRWGPLTQSLRTALPISKCRNPAEDCQ